MPTWKVVEDFVKPATEADATAYTALLAHLADGDGLPFL